MWTARELSGLPKRIRLAAGERLQLGAKLIELLIASTGAFHLRKEYRGRNDTPMLLEAEEPLAEYAPGIRTPAYRQIISAIDNMTHSEQEKVAQFLSREGIRNFLARLDIDESE